MSILDLIEREGGFTYRRKGSSEYTGPCPFCGTGDDRFQIWPKTGRYWCRVCGKMGDDIQFVRDLKGMGYREAVDYVGRSAGDGNLRRDNNDNYRAQPKAQKPPVETWCDMARDFVLDCNYRLMGRNEGRKALDWLNQRGLRDETISGAFLGYNPAGQFVDRTAWGLPATLDDNGRKKKLWLPRGIVVPWRIDGEVWGIRIRRPVGDPKYYFVPGGTPALYNADNLLTGKPAILVEGEIDALTIAQSAGDLAVPVATGGTQNARRARWIARLATASLVLVAYDTDNPGERAASYWIEALPNAARWRPYWEDVNQMAQDDADVRGWVEAGLRLAAAGRSL